MIFIDVTIGKGKVISYPVSIELLEDGNVRSVFNGVSHTSVFSFKEKPWPQKCTISFQIPTLKLPKDTEPTFVQYKGSFKSSLLNPKIVFIRGRIYKSAGSSTFWKKTKKIGTKRHWNAEISV